MSKRNDMKKSDLIEENNELRKEVARLESVIEKLLVDVQSATTIVQFEKDKIERLLSSAVKPIPF